MRVESGIVYIHNAKLTFGMRYNEAAAQLEDLAYSFTG